MHNLFRQAIQSQFGAALDMVENAIAACPDSLWETASPHRPPQFWYIAFHTLFWTDRYLSGDAADFQPPHPYTREEEQPDGDYPVRAYSKEELRSYLEYCRLKLQRTLDRLDESGVRQLHRFKWGEATFAELLVYNLRHIQHGAGQLNLLLRQEIDSAPIWVCQGE
ncbi:MAG: DinB family protein [Rhodothermia bacterium]|nr:DinB family protein [Rhodothermia bacterium]